MAESDWVDVEPGGFPPSAELASLIDTGGKRPGMPVAPSRQGDDSEWEDVPTTGQAPQGERNPQKQFRMAQSALSQSPQWQSANPTQKRQLMASLQDQFYGNGKEYSAAEQRAEYTPETPLKKAGRQALRYGGATIGGLGGGMLGFGIGTAPGAAAGAVGGYAVGRAAEEAMMGPEPAPPPEERVFKGGNFRQGLAEAVYNVPKSATNLTEGALGFPGQLSKAVMTPGGGGQVVEDTKQMVGKPLGFYGADAAKDAWVLDPVGSAGTVAMVAQGGLGAYRGAKRGAIKSVFAPEDSIIASKRALKMSGDDFAGQDRAAARLAETGTVVNSKGTGLGKLIEGIEAREDRLRGIIDPATERADITAFDQSLNPYRESLKNDLTNQDAIRATLDKLVAKMREHPNFDPETGTLDVQNFNEIKRGLQKEVRKAGGFNPDKIPSSTTDANRNIASQAMKTIENLIPDIGPVNKALSADYNLEKYLTQRVRSLQKKDPMSGIGGFSLGLSMMNPLVLVPVVLKSVVNSPGFQSRLAIAIYKAYDGRISSQAAKVKVADVVKAVNEGKVEEGAYSQIPTVADAENMSATVKNPLGDIVGERAPGLEEGSTASAPYQQPATVQRSQMVENPEAIGNPAVEALRAETPPLGLEEGGYKHQTEAPVTRQQVVENPEVNAYPSAEALREAAKKAGVPVAIVTTYLMADDETKARMVMTTPLLAGVIKTKAWETPKQAVSSAATSISYPNVAAKAPVIFSEFRNGKLQLGPVNADIGGGKYNQITDWLATQGVDNIVYDPFNRPEAHNTAAKARLAGGKADTASVSNVLNVIPTKEARAATIQTAYDSVKDGGRVYFSMYEAPKSGEVAGRDSFQTGMKPADYIPEIEKIFGEGSVTRSGNIIAATKKATSNDQLIRDLILEELKKRGRK